jgi:hypothetical protein
MKKYLLIALVILFSCDENSAENTINNDASLIGIWVNQDKGELFEFTKNEVIFAKEIDLKKNTAKKEIEANYKIEAPGKIVFYKDNKVMRHRDNGKIIEFGFEASGEKLKLQPLSISTEEITNFVKYKQKISYSY